MTDQRSDSRNEAVIDEALAVIDGALANMVTRELVSSGEVADLLLDVRMLLTNDPDTVADAESSIVPVIEAIEAVSSDIG